MQQARRRGEAADGARERSRAQEVDVVGGRQDDVPVAAAAQEPGFGDDGDVAVIAEPGLLRGRGYGNVVLAATDDLDLLGSPALARAVRSLPAPARLLHGDEVTAFVGNAAPLADPPA